MPQADEQATENNQKEASEKTRPEKIGSQKKTGDAQKMEDSIDPAGMGGKEGIQKTHAEIVLPPLHSKNNRGWLAILEPNRSPLEF